jgi:hypothetical protein
MVTWITDYINGAIAIGAFNCVRIDILTATIAATFWTNYHRLHASAPSVSWWVTTAVTERRRKHFPLQDRPTSPLRFTAWLVAFSFTVQ